MSYCMGLYGIHGEHTQEACPLYNEENRKYLLRTVPNLEKNAQKYKVKFLHQYYSALEHTFLWVVDADNPHLIEELMGRTAGRFNTVKIVPLITFQTVIERCKKIEEGRFFSEEVAQ
jgi:hypothetical protein